MCYARSRKKLLNVKIGYYYLVSLPYWQIRKHLVSEILTAACFSIWSKKASEEPVLGVRHGLHQEGDRTGNAMGEKPESFITVPAFGSGHFA